MAGRPSTYTPEIYALLCPDTRQVRYIGKANNSVKRLKSHIRDSKTRDTPVYRWFRKLSAENKVPICIVLEVATDGNWQDVEKRLIKEYKNKGAKLLNVAEGGDEPFCSPNQRATNGRNNALSIHSNPKRKQIWQLKKSMGASLKFLQQTGKKEVYNVIVAKLHIAAKKSPNLFGEYAMLTPMV